MSVLALALLIWLLLICLAVLWGILAARRHHLLSFDAQCRSEIRTHLRPLPHAR